jgi:hypothetical protein
MLFILGYNDNLISSHTPPWGAWGCNRGSCSFSSYSFFCTLKICSLRTPPWGAWGCNRGICSFSSYSIFFVHSKSVLGVHPCGPRGAWGCNRGDSTLFHAGCHVVLLSPTSPLNPPGGTLVNSLNFNFYIHVLRFQRIHFIKPTYISDTHNLLWS